MRLLPEREAALVPPPSVVMDLESFKSVFIALVIGGVLIVGAFFIQAQRPTLETQQAGPDLVKATGTCASRHRRETPAIVAEYERSAHVREGTNCLDCHQPQEGQESLEHRGFTLAESLTSKNCSQCHAEENRQFLRSRHAAPAWAAVRGTEDFTDEQVEFAEQFHEGAVDRPANQLAQLEGEAAAEIGCEGCHSVGKPNPDGSIALARSVTPGTRRL